MSQMAGRQAGQMARWREVRIVEKKTGSKLGASLGCNGGQPNTIGQSTGYQLK